MYQTNIRFQSNLKTNLQNRWVPVTSDYIEKICFSYGHFYELYNMGVVSD